MWLDAEKLSDFYEKPLGAIARKYIAKTLSDLWPDVRGDVVLGYGYCVPYLDAFRGEADRVICFMPAPQGALSWPKERKNAVALVEEFSLPLRDQSVDRLILCHALEFTEHIEDLMTEAWRVLRDGGEIIIVTPNRRGAWARITETPFGHGKPYTGRQLFEVFLQAGFTPDKPKYCLYAPPSGRTLTNQLAQSFEQLGMRFWKKLGGVVIISAKKQVLALKPKRTPAWDSRGLKARRLAT